MTYEPQEAAKDLSTSCDGVQPTSPARRRALAWLGALSATLASLAAGVPIVGYLLAPISRRLRRPDAWIALGPVGDFEADKTTLVTFKNPLRQPWDGETGRMAAYVRRSAEGQFVVFSVNCTHLGCPVSWFPQSGLFLCPCHGGAYYDNGQRASGPPPRGLYKYPHREENGQLMALVGHLPTLQDPG